jgi:hypothetical protein
VNEPVDGQQAEQGDTHGELRDSIGLGFLRSAHCICTAGVIEMEPSFFRRLQRAGLRVRKRVVDVLGWRS